MRTLLLNATTIVKGGGVQACASFVVEAIKDAGENFRWIFAMSPQVDRAVSALGCAIPGSARVFAVSPARSIAARRELKRFVKEINPDAIFTFFGPAYVDFARPHLCGVANGWVTHSTLMAFAKLPSLRRRISGAVLVIYRGWWFRKADAWVVEADCARFGLSRRYRVDKRNVHVVPNNCASVYARAAAAATDADYTGEIRVLTLSAYYSHKNLEIIVAMAELLRQRGVSRFRFVLTIPDTDTLGAKFLALIRSRELDDLIQNIGLVSMDDGPALYESCHICFLPSLLETFSANYPEAMAMRRPIVTSDLGFARDVCGEAAIYIDPLNPSDAIAALEQVASNLELRKRLVSDGEREWERLPDQRARYEKYLEILKGLAG